MRTQPDHDVVIIGGGPAAATLVVTLDQMGFGGSVVCFGEEDRLPYDRTVVSKGMLASEPVDPPPLFPEQVAAVTRVNDRVRALDPEGHTVTFDDGSTHTFGRLVLATGGRPWVPPIAGVDQDGVSVLRNAADAEALGAHLGSGARLVIIGGGVIGLEVAAAAVGRGALVSVVEAAPIPMGRVLPSAITRPLLDVHRAAGVMIHLGVRPQQITADGSPLTVVCDTAPGEAALTLDADHVLIATGARPRSDLAEAAGLDTDDGVLVDEFLVSSHPDVLAIGDVARVQGADGQTTRTESYTAAMSMGQHAAKFLAGHPTPYADVPWSWSDQYDLAVQAAGWPDRATTWVERGSADDLDNAFSSLGLTDGRLVAAAGISRGRAVGRIIKAAQGAIAAGVTLTAEQAADTGVDLRRLARAAGQKPDRA